MALRLFVLVAALALLGCSPGPRFGPDVQAAVARDMRRIETDTIVVYYPEGSDEEAERVTYRLDQCVQALRKRTKRNKGWWNGQKPRLVLPAMPLNNAYVAPALAQDPIGVVPTYDTTDLFATLGLAPDPGVIGCHEVVHYVQSLQVSGFDSFVTAVFGAAYSPQLGLDPWFQEGLAVYYETNLQPGVGRLRSRYFEGILAAEIGEEGLDSGKPHVANREPLYGGQYLIGSAFVDWLVQTHGEDKLFAVVDQQSGGILFPFFVESRFSRVYGQSLTSLFRDFVREMKTRYPKVERPAEQRVVVAPEDIGRDARWARARSGHEAVVSEDLDRPTHLVVRDPSGRTILDRNLTDILPGRTLVAPSTAFASGLSFTADGSTLYFVMIDQGSLYQASRLVRVDVRENRLEIVADDLRGPGGSLSPDGRTYYFARANGDATGVAAIDLETKAVRWVRPPEVQRYHSAVKVSPDGRKLAVVRTAPDGSWIAILDAKSGAVLRDLTARGRTVLTPDWVDAEHVLFAADVGGRMQVVVADSSGATRVVSRAPYLVFQPQSDGRTVRFLNRIGYRWSLDEVPLADVVDPRPVNPVSDAAGYPSALPPPTPIRSDEAYSSLERFFVPQVRYPWITARSNGGTILGLGATGGDVLGRHRWGAAVGYNVPGQLVSGQLAYVNGTLAPVSLSIAAAHYASREQTEQGSSIVDRTDPVTGKAIHQFESVGLLSISRIFYGSVGLATGARFDGLVRTLEDHSAALDRRQFGGTYVEAAFTSAEHTPYTGPRRSLAIDAMGTMFPKLFAGQGFSVGDGRASLGFDFPLFLRRLIVSADLRGRYLAGVPKGSELLQVGGLDTISPQLRDATNAPPLGNDIAGVLPPGLRFVEPLAGFEDLTRYDRGVAIGELDVRYPLVADWGSLSTFYVLPSFLFRQIDLVAFADGARFVDARDPSAAVGGRVLVRIALWAVPLSLQFQLARRLTDDEKPAFYFTVLAE